VPDVDPSVLEAARAGAGWAFERIYGQLAPAVHGYLRSQGVDDPEDAVNDVFLRVFGAIGRFDGSPTAFRSWVFAIAHHLVVDRRRFVSRRPAAVATERLPEVPTAAVDDEVLGRFDASVVAGVLRLLTADQRDVLLLRFVADLSLEEVAQAQGRSVGAVKAMQHRALASVRRLLEEISPEAVSPVAPTTLTPT